MGDRAGTHRRTSPLLAVALTALAVVAFAVPAAPAAAAGPVTVLATIPLPRGSYQLSPGLGAMWALSGDESVYSVLYRIDPATDQVTRVADLGFPAGGFAVGYGSVWVTDYYASRLVRLSPAGTTQATVPTGLQPQNVHIAFGSVWTSNHHAHSLTRVDPATDGVTATVDVGAHAFRNGPDDFTADGRYLYVESSNLPYLQRVDPVNDTRTDLTSTGLSYGGDMVWTGGPAGGTLWNQPADAASGRIAMDGYDVLGTVRVTEPVAAGHTPNAIAHLGHTVFYGETLDGVSGHSLVRGVDQVSGAPVVSFATPGVLATLRAGFGSLWVVAGNVVRRIDPGAAART